MWLRRWRDPNSSLWDGPIVLMLDPEDEMNPLPLPISQDFPYTGVRIWRDPSGRFHIAPLFRTP